MVSRCGGSRGTAHSESSREGLSGLGHAGHVAGSRASGGFWEHVACSKGSRMGFFRFRHSGTGGTFRRCFQKGVSKWPVPKEASGLAFGTGVILRRLPKEVPAELRKGIRQG